MLETLRHATAGGLGRQAVEQLSRRQREPEWLLRLRLEAFDHYQSAPRPDQRTEGWRRINLSGLDLDHQTPLAPPANGHHSAGPLPRPFRAGELSGSLALEDGAVAQAWLDADAVRQGVRLLDLGEAVHEAHLSDLVRRSFGTVVPPRADKFAALHYAFWNAGALVYVPRNVVLERPLRVSYSFPTSGVAAFPHTLVVAEEGAALTLLEEYHTPRREGAGLASGAVELLVGRNAQVRYANLQAWADDTWAFSWQRATLAADAHLRTLNVALGSKAARTTVHVSLDGKGAQADLLGAVVADGRQQMDFQTLQDHHGDDTRSDLVFHNALEGRSVSNFTGLIRINLESRRTESSQEQKNFLLSPNARANSDPKLEILNNDVVRCTHGAAVGPLDPELIFYLQTRGLSRADAQALVLEGFFRSVLESLGAPSLLESLWAPVREKLRQ